MLDKVFFEEVTTLEKMEEIQKKLDWLVKSKDLDKHCKQAFER